MKYFGSIPGHFTVTIRVFGAAILAGCLLAAHGSAATRIVNINTSALIGHPAGPFKIGFQLTDGGGVGNKNNTVVISNIQFGGGQASGIASVLGGAIGSLTSSVTLTDSSFLNVLIQPFSPGAQLSFLLTFTTNAEAEETPDQFSISILDRSGNEIPTTGGAAFDVVLALSLGLAGDVSIQTFAGDPRRPPTAGGGPAATGVPSITSFVTVSSATFQSGAVAPDSIVSSFGIGLATATVQSQTSPPPTTLGSVLVKVRDSSNNNRTAKIYLVSPGQVNFVVPPEVLIGKATVSIGGVTTQSADITVSRIAPGVFSLNADGLAAAQVIRTNGSSQNLEDVFMLSGNQLVPKPISFGTVPEELYLVLFGTGIRGRNSLSSVKVNIGSVSIAAAYAGPQPEYPGLDQVNIGPLPRTLLQGKGLVDVVLSVEGQLSKAVRLYFQ